MNNLEILKKFVSTQGYKRNSPDVNNPVNVIPSGNISMNNVDFPVNAQLADGTNHIMYPEQNYQFDSPYVIETPIKQQGGEMNQEQLIQAIAQALQQGTSPEQIVEALIQQGLDQQQATEIVSQVTTRLPQARYGMTVKSNYVSNLDFGDGYKQAGQDWKNVWNNADWSNPLTPFKGSDVKTALGSTFDKGNINRTALGLNQLSDPRLGAWALPNKGLGSGYKAITGLASGLAGSYLGYAKMFSPDKVRENQPISGMTDALKDRVDNPFKVVNGPLNDIAKGKENPLYNGNPNIPGTNFYSSKDETVDNWYNAPGQNQIGPVEFKEGGLKKYQPGGGMYQGNQYADNLNFNNVGNLPLDAMNITYNSMFPYGVGTTTPQQQPTKYDTNVISRGDDSLGFQVANNAIIGFQNFNDVITAKDYEKEYNQMLMRTGNTMNKYNPMNPTNPYGTYTLNSGIGQNYGQVANNPIQALKCGGMKKKYQEGGEYELSQEEIDYILKNGGEIEFID